jgi:N-methylhydantoinase A
MLGRFDFDNFGGGTNPLSVYVSQKVVAARFAVALNIDVTEAAFSVTEMVDESMVNAARAHTAWNCRDIEHLTVIGFGGGAPLHACRLCEELGIRELLVTQGARESAIGFLKAPFS